MRLYSLCRIARTFLSIRALSCVRRSSKLLEYEMILKHEGYISEISYADSDELMHGATINTRAVLHFAGRDIAELKAAFADTIEDYREWCRERGVEPEKPYSGALSLRIAPALHRRIAEKAAQAGESVNQFIADRLEEVA